MLYPAELQALPQARTGTLSQGESLCLGGLLGEEGIREQQFFALALQRSAKGRQLIGFFACQQVFLFAKRGRKANDRDGRLDVAGAVDAAIMFRWDTHRAARERPMGIDGTAPVWVECWTGQVLKLFSQLLAKLIRPVVQHRRCGEARETGLDGCNLIPGLLLNTPALRVGKPGEPLLQVLLIEDRDRKRTDAAPAASLTAGHLFK